MIVDLVSWLEAHEGLAGWAQFVGAIFALAATYVTAFAPGWRRQRQLRAAALRLMAHGYEFIESYDRTLRNFAPFSQSLRLASLSLAAAVAEMERFPVFEIDDQVGPRSISRQLLSMKFMLQATRLELDATATFIEGRTATGEEHEYLKTLIKERLAFAQDLISGKGLVRPIWPSDSGAS